MGAPAFLKLEDVPEDTEKQRFALSRSEKRPDGADDLLAMQEPFLKGEEVEGDLVLPAADNSSLPECN